jgi:predicted small lipoprotein YifL
MRAGPIAKSLLLVAALGVVLSACGRRAPLDTPYQAAVEAREQAERDDERPLPPRPERPAEDRPFILDGLI